MAGSKKQYKIFNKKTREYEGFGYAKRKSWSTWPGINFNWWFANLDMDDYEVHTFDLVRGDTYDLNRNLK